MDRAVIISSNMWTGRDQVWDFGCFHLNFFMPCHYLFLRSTVGTLIILMIWYNTSSKKRGPCPLAFIHSSGDVPCWLKGGKRRFKALEIDKTFIGHSYTMHTVIAVTDWERCQQGNNNLVTNWASSSILLRQLAAYSYRKKTSSLYFPMRISVSQK